MFYILWFLSIILTYIFIRKSLIYDGLEERSLAGSLLYSQELTMIIIFLILFILPGINIIAFLFDHLYMRTINCSYEDMYKFINKIFFIKEKDNK